MTDREKRLMRARTRLAVAIQILETAMHDAGAVREDLEEIIELNVHSLKQVAEECGRELRRGEKS